MWLHRSGTAPASYDNLAKAIAGQRLSLSLRAELGRLTAASARACAWESGRGLLQIVLCSLVSACDAQERRMMTVSHFQCGH